jgi:hypothetical protein
MSYACTVFVANPEFESAKGRGKNITFKGKMFLVYAVKPLSSTLT